MIKTFISFDKKTGEHYKKILQQKVSQLTGAEDISLDYHLDMSTTEGVRQKIRDNFIIDADVLIVVATADARGRRFVDWEIAAAMYDGQVRADGTRNHICGIVVVDCVHENIRTTDSVTKTRYDELTHNSSWINLTDQETRTKYSYLPDRITNSFVNGAHIPVIPFGKVDYLLHLAINSAYKARNTNKNLYDNSPLRVNNSPRKNH